MGEWFSSSGRSDAFSQAVLPRHPSAGLLGRPGALGLPDHGRHRPRRKAVDKGAQDRVSLAALIRNLCGDRADAVAGALLTRFGSIAAVLHAGAEAISDTLPDEPAVAEQLGLVCATLQQALRGQVDARPLLSEEKALVDYLTFSMAHARQEQLRVLFLDARNRLLRDEVMAEGCIRAAAVHPREIVRRAMELSATAMILVHNHPSGDPTPSAGDVEATRRVAAAAALMDIRLHDHLVIARTGWVSLKRLGYC